ncbi:MAG: hypothetical protein ABI759_13790 [Candidatus Solibacter sp.]
MMPPDFPPPAESDAVPAPVMVPPPVYHWYHKMSAIVFITFCLEMGLYLLIVPWTDGWDGNYFSGLMPQLRPYWGNFYVRGAVSGLGMVNLYISLVEIFRLRRFSRR